MFNESLRNYIRRPNANVSNITQLLRISAQYDGALPLDADYADVLPRNYGNYGYKAVRLA